MVIQFFKDNEAYLRVRKEKMEYPPEKTFLVYGGRSLDPFYGIKQAYYMDSAFTGKKFISYGD